MASHYRTAAVAEGDYANQRPNQLKRQTSSVEMNSVAFWELRAALVTPGIPLNGTLVPLPPYCE